MPNFPKNVWILAATTVLASTAAPFFILVGGLLGVQLAPSPEWATLPIAAVVIGSALMTAPSILLLKSLGRKNGSMAGLMVLVLSAFICAYASLKSSFFLLIIGAAFLGAGMAFLQQFRFAAIESIDSPDNIAPALSLLLLSSAAAAFLGPEIASYGRNLSDDGQGFTGSFLLLAGLNIAAMGVLSLFKNPPAKIDQTLDGEKRSLLTIVRQPIFLTAVASATVGFAVMSFLMTSTPVTMNHFHGHSVEDAKWVIQSHMLAMFLPSLFTGTLIKRFGTGPVLLAGASLFALVLAISSSGHNVMHFWWALVLLGIGWNFLFIGGTTLLPQAYKHSERFAAQTVNDCTVFSTQAFASLSAGWVLFHYGWSTQLMICVPFIAVAFVLAGITLFSKNTRAK